MADTDWYRTHYDERYLRVYAPKLSPEATAREAGQIVDRLGLAPGACVLDLACGQGRHSIELASRGFRVTGLDLSPFLLDRARADAVQARAEVRWVAADMRDIPFVGEFDAVISIYTSFGYLENEAEDARVLSAVRRALRPGGRLLVEVMHRDGLLPRLETHGEERRADGTVITHRRAFDPGTSRLDDHTTIVGADGVRQERSTSIRLYTVPEWRRMCADAGLRLEAWFGGLDGSPLALASRRLAIVASKP